MFAERSCYFGRVEAFFGSVEAFFGRVEAFFGRVEAFVAALSFLLAFGVEARHALLQVQFGQLLHWNYFRVLF